MGLAAGKSEEQISASLGTPKSVAQAILVNSYVTEAENSKSIVDRSGAILQMLVAVLILAPFNFFVLVCPFVLMVTFVIVGWTVPLVAITIGFAMVVGVLPALGLLGFLTGMSLLSAGVGTLALALMSGILMVWMTRGLLALVVSYCKWNLNFIQARRAI